MMTFKYTWYILTKASKVQCGTCSGKTTAVVIMTNVPGSEMRNIYVDTKNKDLKAKDAVIAQTVWLDHENIEVGNIYI